MSARAKPRTAVPAARTALSAREWAGFPFLGRAVIEARVSARIGPCLLAVDTPSIHHRRGEARLAFGLRGGLPDAPVTRHSAPLELPASITLPDGGRVRAFRTRLVMVLGERAELPRLWLVDADEFDDGLTLCAPALQRYGLDPSRPLHSLGVPSHPLMEG